MFQVNENGSITENVAFTDKFFGKNARFLLLCQKVLDICQFSHYRKYVPIPNNVQFFDRYPNVVLLFVKSNAWHWPKFTLQTICTTENVEFLDTALR